MTATGWLARRDVALGAMALLFAVQAAVRFSSRLTHDAAWYLYAAGRLLDGAALYRDIVEVNPPLGIWLTVPVAATARLAGLPATGSPSTARTHASAQSGPPTSGGLMPGASRSM